MLPGPTICYSISVPLLKVIQNSFPFQVIFDRITGFLIEVLIGNDCIVPLWWLKGWLLVGFNKNGFPTPHLKPLVGYTLF